AQAPDRALRPGVLVIESDRFAAGFYARMGARQTGAVAAPMDGDPNRRLPGLEEEPRRRPRARELESRGRPRGTAPRFAGSRSSRSIPATHDGRARRCRLGWLLRAVAAGIPGAR